MTTLEDLYYGNIAPYERYIKHGSREEKVLKLLCRNEERLTKNLNNRQKEIFNKFTDCQSEMFDLTARGILGRLHTDSTADCRSHGRSGNGGRGITG